jgi:hypothetical protein
MALLLVCIRNEYKAQLLVGDVFILSYLNPKSKARQGNQNGTPSRGTKGYEDSFGPDSFRASYKS